MNRGSSAVPSQSHPLRTKLLSAAKQAGRTALGIHFANHCRTYGAKLYHEPNYLPFAANLPTVITVHDLSVLLHPEWHPADRVREHAKRLERAAANAEHIITDTEQVRREVLQELGVHSAKVTAVPLGVGPEFRQVNSEELATWRQRLNLPEKYFLCVGTIEPRKNLLTAMQAFADLPAKEREHQPLLLAGPWGWKADAEFAFFERTGKNLGIRHLGYVPDAALPALYTGATATLYPSLYEGFGLPPLEAVACGSIAICSRGTIAVREVMGNAAIYCNAIDVTEWRDAMQQLIENRAEFQRRGAGHADRFTWRRTAEATLAVYDDVLNGSRVPDMRAAA